MPTKNTKSADAGPLDALVADAVARAKQADQERADREEAERRNRRRGILDRFRVQLAATLGDDVAEVLAPLAKLGDRETPAVQFDHGGRTFRLWEAGGLDWRLSVLTPSPIVDQPATYRQIMNVTPGHAERDGFLRTLAAPPEPLG